MNEVWKINQQIRPVLARITKYKGTLDCVKRLRRGESLDTIEAQTLIFRENEKMKLQKLLDKKLELQMEDDYET